MLDDLARLNEIRHGEVQDPEITNRIAQYEMAFRMQSPCRSSPTSRTEPESTFQFYGPESRKPGTFASNCILARRLAERGVRFIQLYHRGWDQHNDLPGGHRTSASTPTQPSAALVQDLKRRGLLDDTLVIWGGEFGRTIYSQGSLDREQLRARPPPALFLHVDGRRRHQEGHGLRPNRRLLLQHRRRPRARPRPERHDPEPPGGRPYPVDLQASGTSLSPD